MLEQDLKLGAAQCCLSCDKIKPLELGEAVIRYGSFIEFICYQCKDNKTTQEKREEIHLAMLEDFGNVIAKHLPNFDNNLEAQTWNFLVLFTEEAIAQLLGKGKN